MITILTTRIELQNEKITGNIPGRNCPKDGYATTFGQSVAERAPNAQIGKSDEIVFYSWPDTRGDYHSDFTSQD